LLQNPEAFNTRVVLRANLLINRFESCGVSIYLISARAFILGLIISWLYNLLDRFHLKREITRLRNEIKNKDKELNSLRNLPITSENVPPGVSDSDMDLA
ncbi:MAG: LapA family protein, partial [Deltaproteobacteria bacterium]|nr:LapA family protein [Deltaproteobacteria bacterium]